MAVYENQLKLDIGQFVTATKKAVNEAGKLPENKEINITADSKDAVADTKKVDNAVTALPDEKIINVSVEGADKAEKTLGGIGDKLSGAAGALSGGVGGILSSIPIPQVAAAGAVIGVVGGAIGSLVSKGREATGALKKLQLQTGASAEEMTVLEEQAEIAFQKGVGESISESINIIGELRRTLGDLVPPEFLGEATAKANTFAKSIGVETPELIGKISPLIKQYGLDFDQALNLVASGAQKGVADIGGYLDAINEFTPNAKEAGLSAEEFGGLLQRAAAGGVKDLAKVGDGIKEINNRIKSGDLSTQVAAIGGDVGKQLQYIAKLGEEGVLQTKEVLAQSVQAINAAAAKGDIVESTRGQLLTLLGGSIAEDVGSELYSDIFSQPIDVKDIQANAAKAGQGIADALAKQDPFEQLSRGFDTILSDIGKGLIEFYSNVIAPIITPIIDGFIRIKDSISKAFAGDGLKSALGFFDTIKQVVGGEIGVLVDNIVTTFDIIVSTLGEIFDTVGEAFAPLADIFAKLGGEGEGVSDIFETIKNVMRGTAEVVKTVLAGAIKILVLPLKFVVSKVVDFITFLIKLKDAVVGAVEQFAKWLLGIEPVRAAIEGLVAFVINLKDQVVGLATNIGKALGIIDDSSEAAADATKKLTKAQQENVQAGEQQKAIIQDINQLAAEFTNKMSAASANLNLLLSAMAGGATGLADQARKARGELAKLEAAQDAASLAVDPVRQQQLKAQREQAAAETITLEKMLTASLIAESIQRDRELLKIQQEADKRALDESIKAAQTVINVGGAGLPEAKAQLVALNEERKRLVLQQAADLKAIEGKAQEERLSFLLASEQRIKDAASALTDASIIDTDRQLAAMDTSLDTLTKATEARVKQIGKAAEQEARALIEQLPAFQKGMESIQFRLESGQIDADAAFAEINDLRTRLLDELLAVPAGEVSEFGKQIQNIFTKAARDATDASREIADAFKDSQVSIIRSDTLRAIEEQVRALEKQRDLLLLNANLTQEQAREINDGFGTAIDKVRRGPVKGLDLSVKAIGESLRDAKFDLSADEAKTDAEDVKKQIDAINEALALGKISYQEAIDQLRGLSAETSTFMSRLGEAFAQATAAVAAGQQAAVDSQLETMRTLEEEKKKIQRDTTLTGEQQAEQQAALNLKIADSQAAALESIAVNAGASFVNLIAQSQSAGDAVKAIAGQTAKSLLALYTPQIIALFSSVIPPPFGLIAGGIAVAGLQALLQAALSSFDKGGATGGRRGEVRGVVHGEEWVANPKVYKKNKALLDHLHKGGDAKDFYNPTATVRYGVNGSGDLISMMAEMRDTLRGLPAMVEVRESQDIQLGLDHAIVERERQRKMRRSLSK